jgi:hypothetical protein
MQRLRERSVILYLFRSKNLRKRKIAKNKVESSLNNFFKKNNSRTLLESKKTNKNNKRKFKSLQNYLKSQVGKK